MNEIKWTVLLVVLSFRAMMTSFQNFRNFQANMLKKDVKNFKNINTRAMSSGAFTVNLELI